MFGLKSGKSANINLPCLSRFGGITDGVRDRDMLAVEDVADDDGVSCGLHSFSSVFRFFLLDPSINTADNARLGAIVDFEEDFSKVQSRNIE